MTVPSVVNIAGYKFVELDDLPGRRAKWKSRCLSLGLKGTILLSAEGVNLFLAGARAAVDDFLDVLRDDPPLRDFSVKESFSDRQPFNRLLVRIKNEIIAFGVDGVDPRVQTAPKLPPTQLKQWLDERRPVTLLDTRNDYEVGLGTFEGAMTLPISHFRDFPEAVRSMPEDLKEAPIVMFCTGGIRCEKAGPFMQNAGFKNVLQLDGGILKYFEECGGEHWNGECFVFDQRVALDPQLRETQTKECFACKTPLTIKDQQSRTYVPGESCPHCFEDAETAMRKRIDARHRSIKELADPLPGSQPYDNERPINIPLRLDGRSLLDCLDELLPQVGRENWRRICDEARMHYNDRPADALRAVRAGERYVHKLPATVEPDVNADIRILFEDEQIVAVNKPAPLPMHPSGRFSRNTLQYLLNQVYSPQKLRPAHRLDANTTGIVLLSRSKSIASKLQPQFDRRTVAKTYLALVDGTPRTDRFVCETPVSTQTMQAGLRRCDPNGLAARTEFRVLCRRDDGRTLLEAVPITGRTNQIRVHLWDLGIPIVGDPAYLAGKRLGEVQTLSVDAPPLCLHAWRIAFDHPWTGRRIELETPPPVWSL